MKNILILLITYLFFHSRNDAYYYHKDILCSFYFSTIKEYQLTLKEYNEFRLIITTSDTRYKAKGKQEFTGSFEYKGDTLMLKFVNHSLKTYYPKEIDYLSRGDSLIIKKQDVVLPNCFKRTTYLAQGTP